MPGANSCPARFTAGKDEEDAPTVLLRCLFLTSEEAFLFLLHLRRHSMRLQTRTIHIGVDKDTAYNSVITPIYQTSTFRFTDIGATKGYDYTRSANPTRKALEESIASLEGAPALSRRSRHGCHCDRASSLRLGDTHLPVITETHRILRTPQDQ
jgi:hypothetical protein